MAYINFRDKADALIHDGLVSEKTMLNACLKYMSCAEIRDMLETNDMLADPEEDLDTDPAEDLDNNEQEPT